MSKAPAFQLYARDFLGDHLVDAMEPEELGGYFRLLLIAWQQDDQGYLPNNEKLLASWSKLGRRWKKHGPAILACFRTADDGRLYQKRMVEVAADQAEYREGQRQKGLAAAAARAAAAAARAAEEANRGSTAAQPRLLSGSSLVPTEAQPEGNSSPPSSPPPENEESSLAHVREASAWRKAQLETAWVDVVCKTPSGNWPLLDRVSERITASARSRSVHDVDAHARRLLTAFVAVVDGWRDAKRPAPQKSVEAFEKHFAAAEEVIDGERDPKCETAPSSSDGGKAGYRSRAPMAPVAESRNATLDYTRRKTAS